jgi:hypothetical protein
MAYPTPYPIPPAPSPQESQLIQQLSMPIFQARGWLKFLGVLSIISGIGSALSIFGIIFAWLPIWMGVLMFQAGSSIESAGQLGDKFSFLRSLGSLKTYFVLQGILTLLAIVFAASILCITVVLPLLGLTLIPWKQIINNTIPYY